MNNETNHSSPEEPFSGARGSVWPTGSVGLDTQFNQRGYHEATRTDPALMPPAIAEHAIATLTRRNDIVLDPDCGAGTTVVEALRAGRHAIGLTGQHRWWRLTRTNVTAVKARGAPVDGMVLVFGRRPGTVSAAENAGLTGGIALLLTSLRPTRPVFEPGDATGALRTLLGQCRPLIRPGGHVVVTTPPLRHPVHHGLLDIPGAIQVAGKAAGFAPVARCLALTTEVRSSLTYTHVPLAERQVVARVRRSTGHPCALTAHHNVLIFRTDPDTPDPALTPSLPTLPTPPRCERALA